MLTHWRQGQGEPVVLVHGWGQRGAVFAPLAPFLPKVELFCPDLPGHGGSAPVVAGTLEGWVDALDEWWRQVVPVPCHLVAWSLGGTLALHLLTRGDYADRCRSLTLIGATPCFIEAPNWPGMPLKQLRLLRSGLRRQPTQALAAFDRLVGGSPKPSSAGEPEALDQGLDILQHSRLQQDLKRIKQPVFQVHGTKDQVVPVAAAQRTAALFGAQLCCLECGHAPFIEQPQVCAELLRGFWHEQ